MQVYKKLKINLASYAPITNFIGTLIAGCQTGTKIRSPSFGGFAFRNSRDQAPGSRCISSAWRKHVNGAIAKENEHEGPCALCTSGFTRKIRDRSDSLLPRPSKLTFYCEIFLVKIVEEKGVRMIRLQNAFTQIEFLTM